MILKTKIITNYEFLKTKINSKSSNFENPFFKSLLNYEFAFILHYLFAGLSVWYDFDFHLCKIKIILE